MTAVTVVSVFTAVSVAEVASVVTEVSVIAVASVVTVVTSAVVAIPVLSGVEVPLVFSSPRNTPPVGVVVSSVVAVLGFVRRLVTTVVRVEESGSVGVE